MSVSVPITSTESEGIARVREPLTMGLPFPRGLVRRLSQLSLRNPDGEPQPVQFAPLSRWPDGSVQWGLLDFQIDLAAHASTQYTIHLDERGVEPPGNPSIAMEESVDGFRVHTGVATFEIGRTRFVPGWGASIGGGQLTDRSESRCLLRDVTGQSYTPRVEALSVETQGPLRTTIRIDGRFCSGPKTFCHFLARLSFFAGSATVRLALTVHNPRGAHHSKNLWDLGDARSIYIRDMSLRIALAGQGRRKAVWSTEPGSPFAEIPDEDLEIYQDSSGGQNWASRNHVNRHNETTTSFCGYALRAGERQSGGRRAQPLVAVYSGSLAVAGAVRDFWQNFPKAIEVSGSSLVVSLFPRQSRDPHELQGGERKTHVVHISFLQEDTDLSGIDWIRGRLVARAPVEWYASSSAIPYVTPRTVDRNAQYLALVDAAIEGPHAFDNKREAIDEYGWRHFGDLYADHEAVHYEGPPPVISHYNNQYDVIYGAFVQFARSGDARWFSMMDQLASHVVDIDIYHTTEDRPEYSGGPFWHTNHYTSAFTGTHRSFSRRAGRPGGGPSSGHCYTSGLMHHYFLTGEVASREAVIGLASWITAMEDGARGRLRWLDRGPTGCASATHTRSYHGPGRGPANAINTLLDAFLLSDERDYLDRAEDLIRRCIHPRDDVGARRLDDAEQRWSYTMFLQVLGRYLDIKIQWGQLDVMYAYARESLLAYARWMAEHEAPYLLRPDRLEFPTETWSAQDMRKSDVFKFATKHSSGAERERFRERSGFFFRSSVAELMAFPTRNLTRPVVIMMTCGYMHAYFDLHPDETAPAAPIAPDFGTPQRFVSQRDRVLTKLKAVGAAGLAAGLVLAYHFWRR